MLLKPVIFLFAVSYKFGDCLLWPKGVVHYNINAKDYDLHSQDEIISTLAQIERELCVKFFGTPDRSSYNVSTDKILYISNPEKIKDCPPVWYDYSGQVVDMPIGYKCINQKDISRIVVAMLRASVNKTDSLVNSYDLIRRFKDVQDDPSRPSLLSPSDRNYLNAAYAHECALLTSRPGLHASYKKTYRRGGDADDKLEEQDALSMSEENHAYYDKKLWPLGVIMYGVHESLKDTPDHATLRQAITSIELVSCLVFQELAADGVLAARSALWFAKEGASEPALGTQLGNQTLSLPEMTHGAPGHAAHTTLLLLRAAGVPMASNRPDRGNYVTVHWRHVQKGKEHLLERLPEGAWLRQLSYDFDSVTHAPANYACGQACQLGATTVEPTQDQLWQRTLKMGHSRVLSDTDVKILQVLYGAQCQQRFAPTAE